jgi:glycine/D-amino acid oxidase-like deaminating enzyme
MTFVPVEHLDVLIVGGGLSGIGMAVHLKKACPRKSFAVLEARAATGGTWDLFRYPGVRSDSDMFTLGYKFKPWEGAKAIADGADILDYIREAADEHGITPKIRLGHKVRRASWSTADNRWMLEIERAGGETLRLSCNMLIMCAGYYPFDRGDGRARDHAAALADLHRALAGGRSARRVVPAQVLARARLQADPGEERAARHVFLSRRTQEPRRRQGAPARPRRRPARTRGPHRSGFHADL